MRWFPILLKRRLAEAIAVYYVGRLAVDS